MDRPGPARRASGISRSMRAMADAPAPGVRSAVTFATTEHFNLQVSRAVTVSEANGRASIYLAALASNLIALAFIGQMSRLGTAFYAFALILLPVLAFVGTVRFASGAVLGRGHRVRSPHRPSAQLLLAGCAGARAVSRCYPAAEHGRRRFHGAPSAGN